MTNVHSSDISKTRAGAGATVVRIFGWSMLFALIVFLVNDYLQIWQGWPPLRAGTVGFLWAIEAGFYVAALLASVMFVTRGKALSLARDARRISSLNAYLIRAAFWSVLFIGLVDFSIALLTGEELLDDVFGTAFAQNLSRAIFRGNYVHFPLVALGFAVAYRVRAFTLPILAVLIVGGELAIVISRFVFSFEQAYMVDLVRFWYAGLFLFGSAYTLREGGHVRVDVLYTNFSRRTKGYVNALGAVILGIPFCWLILVVGLSGKTGVINSALLTFEREGSGGGMNILYLMTVFMGVFAITMMIEFVAMLFNAVADIRGETRQFTPTQSPETFATTTET